MAVAAVAAMVAVWEVSSGGGGKAAYLAKHDNAQGVAHWKPLAGHRLAQRLEDEHRAPRHALMPHLRLLLRLLHRTLLARCHHLDVNLR